VADFAVDKPVEETNEEPESRPILATWQVLAAVPRVLGAPPHCNFSQIAASPPLAQFVLTESA
jgi:hypothetical protein